MSLISTTNLKLLADHYANGWDLLIPSIGLRANQAAPVAGTVQYAMDAALDLITVLSDYEQETDLLPNGYTALTKANRESAAAFITAILQAIDAHCATRGKQVSTSITTLSTYLTYYNGGSGGAKFANMLTPTFGDLWFALVGSRLVAAGVMSPARHPDWDIAVSANGMGSRAVGGSFAAGTAVDNTLYSEVLPLVEVTADFVGGGAAPTVTVAGTDDTGVLTTTWSVTLDSNNPVSAVSTTITPAVTAQARQTVAVASASGIVAGSVLKVNAGLVDQETVIAETVAGSDVTAVFAKAHLAGAALTGKRTYATTPSVALRRVRSVSGLTVGVTGHGSGTVRVIGSQSRVPA